MLKSGGSRASAAIALGLLPLATALALLLSPDNVAPSLAGGASPQLHECYTLVCPNLIDIAWDVGLHLTTTHGGEVCSIDWTAFPSIRRGPDPYSSDTQYPLAYLAPMQSFYRDKTVVQGVPYHYDTLHTYVCPSDETIRVSRRFGTTPVTPGPSCEGDLVQDLSLSGIELLEPGIRVWQGATLSLDGVTVRGGWIKSAGHGDSVEPPGGVLRFTNVTLRDSPDVQFNAVGNNLLDRSTIHGDPYQTEVYIASEAEVYIEDTKFYSGCIMIRDEPDVTITDSDFHRGAVTVQSGAPEGSPSVIRITGNRFYDAAQAVAIWQYGGHTRVTGNTFVGTEASKTRKTMHVRNSLDAPPRTGFTDFSNNRVSGYDTALTLLEGGTALVSGNLITDCNKALYVRYDSVSAVRGNTITGCGRGLTAWDEPTADLRQNCIAENVTGIDISLWAGVGLNVDAAENWWGHPSGPLHTTNPGGDGNYVGSRAIISPWLTIDNCFVDLAVDVIGPAGGTVSTSSGTTSLSVPSGAVSQDTRVSIRPMDTSAMSTMPSPPGKLSGVRLLQVASQDDTTGSPVTTLEKEALLTVRLSQPEAARVDPATLTGARLDSGAHSLQGGTTSQSALEWVLLPTQVDVEARVLTVTTEYLGTFAVFGSSAAASTYLPLVLR
jgi:hypothetical protein